MAESPDGKYVLLKYANGIANSQQWFRRTQITFDSEYTPVHRTPSAPTVKRLERHAEPEGAQPR